MPASSATPAPVMPPPMTSTSKRVSPSCWSDRARSKRAEAHEVSRSRRRRRSIRPRPSSGGSASPRRRGAGEHGQQPGRVGVARPGTWPAHRPRPSPAAPRTSPRTPGTGTRRSPRRRRYRRRRPRSDRGAQRRGRRAERLGSPEHGGGLGADAPARGAAAGGARRASRRAWRPSWAAARGPTRRRPPRRRPRRCRSIPSMPWWLQGGFAPVAEEVESTRLEVVGALPPELTGLYVRNGSNPRTGVSPHWFLGDGMVHGIRLDGRAGRLVPQPLRPHAALRGVVRVRRGRARRGGVAEQRVGDLARRQAAHLRRGRATRTSCRPTTSARWASTTSAAG